MIIDIILIALFILLIFKIEAKQFPYASIVFILLYVIYIYSGSIMMNYDEYIPKDENFENLQFIVRGGFASIVFAYFLSYITLKRNSLDTKECMELSNSKEYAFYFISAIVIFISLLYLKLIPNNPFIAMIKDPSNLSLTREQATTTFSNFGFFNNFISFFLPLVWLTLLFINKKAYIVLFLFNLIVLMSTGQKSPIVYLLFLLVIALSLRNKKFKYKKNILLVLVVIFTLLIIVILQNWHILNGLSLDSLELAWIGLKKRIFYGGVFPLKQYLEFFPAHMNHYYFNPPLTTPDKLVYAFFYPDTGIVGTVNTVSIANMYAAFGSYLIVFILFFILSFSFFTIDKLIFNHMKTPFEFAFYTAYSLVAIKLVITDWYSIIPQFLILSLAFIGGIYFIEAFLFYFASNKRKFLIYTNNKIIGVFSMVIFLYFIQGQIRGILHG